MIKENSMITSGSAVYLLAQIQILRDNVSKSKWKEYGYNKFMLKESFVNLDEGEVVLRKKSIKTLIT